MKQWVVSSQTLVTHSASFHTSRSALLAALPRAYEELRRQAEEEAARREEEEALLALLRAELEAERARVAAEERRRRQDDARREMVAANEHQKRLKVGRLPASRQHGLVCGTRNHWHNYWTRAAAALAISAARQGTCPPPVPGWPPRPETAVQKLAPVMLHWYAG
jgi:hypothetical protein